MKNFQKYVLIAFIFFVFTSFARNAYCQTTIQESEIIDLNSIPGNKEFSISRSFFSRLQLINDFSKNCFNNCSKSYWHRPTPDILYRLEKGDEKILKDLPYGFEKFVIMAQLKKNLLLLKTTNGEASCDGNLAHIVLLNTDRREYSILFDYHPPTSGGVGCAFSKDNQWLLIFEKFYGKNFAPANNCMSEFLCLYRFSDETMEPVKVEINQEKIAASIKQYLSRNHILEDDYLSLNQVEFESSRGKIILKLVPKENRARFCQVYINVDKKMH